MKRAFVGMWKELTCALQGSYLKRRQISTKVASKATEIRTVYHLIIILDHDLLSSLTPPFLSCLVSSIHTCLLFPRHFSPLSLSHKGTSPKCCHDSLPFWNAMVADTTLILAFSVEHEIFLNAACVYLKHRRNRSKGSAGHCPLTWLVSQRLTSLF